MSRRVEVGIGLVTGLVALLGLGFVVFGPVTFSYPPPDGAVTAASTSLWNYGLDTASLLFLAAMLIATLAAAGGAYLRSRGEGAPALTLMWGGFLLLLAGCVTTLPGSSNPVTPAALATGIPDSLGVGIYLAPAVCLACLNAVLGTAARPLPVRPPAPTPR
ncbi:MAG TPA: hypothetical protein VFN57_17040 [Thermomicrobiaceae bacterium]|nr:hypothetical protein [Thermomicrobiaceae bacterium]